MRVSIVTVNYNSHDQLRGLLESIHAAYSTCSLCEQVEVIIIDNASTIEDYRGLMDTVDEYSRDPAIAIRVRRLSRNYGYAGGVNVGVRLASHEVVVVSNPDIVLEKDFLEKLTKIYASTTRRLVERSIIAPKILLGDQGIVNSTGLALHIAGYGILLNLNKVPSHPDCNRLKLVLAPHGALFIAYKHVLLDLGPFDPYYFSFLEDLDLGIRAYLNGYYVVYVPVLVAKHYWGTTWGRRLSKTKYYYTERNRLLTLLKNLPTRLLVALAPYIALSEVVSTAYAALNRYTHVKARIYADIARSIPYIMRWRTGGGRSDLLEQVLRALVTIEFTHIIFDNKYLKLVNSLYKALYRVVGVPWRTR